MSDNTIPSKPLKAKNPDTIRRYRDYVPPTPGTIQHDGLAEAYARGATDALRAVMVAAQAALNKRDVS